MNVTGQKPKSVALSDLTLRHSVRTRSSDTHHHYTTNDTPTQTQRETQPPDTHTHHHTHTHPHAHTHTHQPLRQILTAPLSTTSFSLERVIVGSWHTHTHTHREIFYKMYCGLILRSLTLLEK